MPNGTKNRDRWHWNRDSWLAGEKKFSFSKKKISYTILFFLSIFFCAWQKFSFLKKKRKKFFLQIDSPEDKGSSISPKKGTKQNQDTSTHQNGMETLKSEGVQAGGTLQNKTFRREQLHHTKSADYTELEMQNGNIFNIVNNNHTRKSKSKSTDDMRIENAAQNGMSLDSNTLKRMLKPMSSVDSPVTSPEMSRKRHHVHPGYHYHPSNNNQKYMMSEGENENYYYRTPYNNKFQGSRSVHDMARQYSKNSTLKWFYF